MSKQTQIQFKQLIEKYYGCYGGVLHLEAPTIHSDGFVSKATMLGTKGVVEILCGPAEYHAEVFIELLEDGKRWNLADLMSFDIVREWLVDYSKEPSSSDKSELEADIEWIFMILTDVIKGLHGFEWLHASTQSR